MLALAEGEPKFRNLGGKRKITKVWFCSRVLFTLISGDEPFV